MFVNLAYLLNRPTGTTSYALNLLPYLNELSPTYLATPASGLMGEQKNTANIAQLLPERPNQRIGVVSVPTNLTAAEGTAGHIRRLMWTQFQLPRLISARANRQPLLFAPIPEAPLWFGSAPLRSVVMCHDLIPLRFPNEFGAIKAYFRYYVPRVLAQAEKVICNSQATARDIVDFYDLPAEKIVSIPLGYDAAHFRPAHERPDVFSALTISDAPYFLTLGRQAPYKNIGAVIKAIAPLPGVQLVIAGPPDPRYTPSLEKLAEVEGVRSRVHFLSYVPYQQLPALMSAAIALVFPSLWEGFGLPVLEAMACGTPVIASNAASLTEVTGDAAYLVNPRCLPEISEAMRAISTDKLARQQLSRAGLQRAKQFSWEKTGSATVAVLRAFV